MPEMPRAGEYHRGVVRVRGDPSDRRLGTHVVEALGGGEPAGRSGEEAEARFNCRSAAVRRQWEANQYLVDRI